MRPDLLRWLGCGLVAALGLLAVTMAPQGPDASRPVVHEDNAGKAAPEAAAVASAVRAQP